MTRTAVIDTSLQEAHEWLQAVSRELGTSDEKSGLAALRAALHVVRNSLTMAQAIELGDYLPVLIRGLYYEGWSPERQAEHKAVSGDVMKNVRRDTRGHDELAPAEKTLGACFSALARLLPQDEVQSVLNALPASVRQLWPAAARGSPYLQDWQWR